MSTEQIVSSPMSDAPKDDEVLDEPGLEVDIVDDTPEEDGGEFLPSPDPQKNMKKSCLMSATMFRSASRS